MRSPNKLSTGICSRLEEVDQQPSINNSLFASARASQNEQLFWSVTWRWLFWKTSIVFISMSSDHRDERIIKLFFHLNNQNMLYVGSIETWGEQRRLNFWRYLVVIFHTCNHFNLGIFILDLNWNCCRLQEAKNFSRNPGQFKRNQILHVHLNC